MYVTQSRVHALLIYVVAVSGSVLGERKIISELCLVQIFQDWYFMKKKSFQFITMRGQVLEVTSRCYRMCDFIGQFVY